MSQRCSRQIYVLPVAGGWTQVVNRFLLDHVKDMEKFPLRYMVLLIDFDRVPQRLTEASSSVPLNLRERVYILGVLSEPEELKKELGSYEAIGSALAQDCREGFNHTWDHDLLRHNSGELARLRKDVRPILFETG